MISKTLASISLAAMFIISTPAAAQPSAASNTYVERITGADAKRHIENLHARHSGAFARARQVLKEKGWRETQNIQVFRTNRQVASKGSPYIATQQSYSGVEGEVVAWEFEDADYDTWAGTIYLHEYSTGTWMVVDCQMSLAPNAEWGELWSQIIDGEDRGPRDIDPVRGLAQPNSSYLRTGGTPDSSAYLKTQIRWGNIQNKWSDWGSCTLRSCAGAAIGCNAANPTPQEKPDVAFCTAGWCLAGSVVCLEHLK